MSFTDVILEEINGKALCFRSGKMVYEESYLDGMYVASGSNASAYPAASNPLPRPTRLDSSAFWAGTGTGPTPFSSGRKPAAITF